MRLVGRGALHRSAVHLTRGTVPTTRELLLDLKIPWTYLLPEADGSLPGTGTLTAAGVSVVAIPDCGHNIMLDNLEAFASATAAARRRSARGHSLTWGGRTGSSRFVRLPSCLHGHLPRTPRWFDKRVGHAAGREV
ncbi:hypothetical protein GCM10010353_72190 [Streptomyces chryseus]|nr:hypothetical protein GCM10010353_72190 [Streptomyces chryseus]